jgi:hypothetical protein
VATYQLFVTSLRLARRIRVIEYANLAIDLAVEHPEVQEFLRSNGHAA